MDEILREYCDDFCKKMGYDYVAKNAIPIAWFGNIEQYFKSRTKVLTISLNPSYNEFPQWGKQRFQDLTAIRDGIIQKDYPLDLMMKNYNDYFKFNPYMQWFSFYERRLNELDCSYYDTPEKNTAIHIDMYSAIATEPTWGKLSDLQKYRIQNIPLFRELLKILNPQIALVSVNLFSFKEVIQPDEAIKEWVPPFDDRKCSRMILYKKDGIKFLHGRNLKGQPFGACRITEEIKRTLFE